MIELALKDIEKYYGANKILENVTFDINQGERIAIIGQNGCGKTTAFKIISGIENYDKGMMSIRKGAAIGYLDQIPIYSENCRVIDVLNSAFDEIYKVKNEMENLEHEMSNTKGEGLERIMKRYSQLQEVFESIGGYGIEEKMSKICTGLKLSDEFIQRSFNTLSGGEKTTVILAKILLQNPDILLLDEPTNHLDIDSIEWLEEFLCNYKGTVLIISHDRYFLDKVVNKVVEIENGESNLYLGNYSYYIVEKERRILEQLEEYKQQQKKIKAMEDAIKRFRDWGTRGDDERFFKKAANMQKRIEKMEKVDRPVTEKKKMKLNFTQSERTGKEVIHIENLNKSFDGKNLLENTEFHLQYKDKAVIIGKNGCGKSTLIKIIMDEYNIQSNNEEYSLELTDMKEYHKDSGEVKIGSNVKIAYLDQNVIFENENHTVIEAFRDTLPMPEGQARGILARFLFYGEDVFKKVGTLSGGERSRLRLCQLMHQDINVLILDEPTNHLDIDSREMLEKALEEFEGTILFISHDRYFINKIAGRIIELRDKKLINYNGNYDYYKEEQKKENLFKDLKQKSSNESENLSSKSFKYNETQSDKKDSYKENRIKNKEEKARLRALKKLEEEISKLELEIETKNKEIEQYACDYGKLDEIYSEKEELQKALDSLLERWLQLNM